MKPATPKIKARLEYLRGELNAERISYGELHELQSLAEYIDPGDVQLREAAGIKEIQKKPMSQRKYRSLSGGRCPVCGSDQIAGESVNICSGSAEQECRCIACEASWMDTYKLTGYVNLQLLGKDS